MHTTAHHLIVPSPTETAPGRPARPLPPGPHSRRIRPGPAAGVRVLLV
jgi:hypothetical protein